MTVEAPVCAKHEKKTLVFACGPFFGLLDFGVRIGIVGINVFLHVGRLLQLGRIGSFGGDKMPLFALLHPVLIISDTHGLTAGRAGSNVGTKDDAGSIRAHDEANDFDFHGARLESEPETHVGIGVMLHPVQFNRRRWLGTVKAFEC
jgi:hypothetical protein